MALIILVISLILQINTISAAGSCGERRLCCQGRDSSCVVQKSTPINAIIEDLNEKQCYCDGACITLGDCCHDYKKTCGGKSFNKCHNLLLRSLLNIHCIKKKFIS